MSREFSCDEKRYIRELLAWDSSRQSIEWLLCNIALVAAGALIISTALITAANLNDRVVQSVLVPGFVIGLFFVGIYVLARNRVKERHRMASIVKKMTKI